MGALQKKMPVTFWTFLIGTLALCGVPPLSGFYSKDGILAAAFAHSNALFVLATVVALLTTFYMSRLFLVAFLGRARSEAADHAHESPGIMTWPLVFLAALTVTGGFLGIHGFVGHHFKLEQHHVGLVDQILEPFGHSPIAAFFGLFAVMIGFSAAVSLYWNAKSDPLPGMMRGLTRAMRNRFYFDELYEKLIDVSQEALSRLADSFDRWIVAGLFVRGISGSTELVGRVLRLVQTGNLQTYAFLLAAGVALVLYIALFRP